MGLEDLNLTSSNESIISIVKELFNTDNIKLKSDISDKQIETIALLQWANECKQSKKEDGLTILNEKIIPNIMELQISKNRKSREEIKSILSSLMPTLIEKETNTADEIKK